MKAMGAGLGMVAALFLAESAVLALGGGLAGFALGSLLAQQIGRAVFASGVPVQPVLLPMVLTVAALVTFLGSAIPIRRAMELAPAVVLRTEA